MTTSFVNRQTFPEILKKKLTIKQYTQKAFNQDIFKQLRKHLIHLKQKFLVTS